jgi:threonine dehydrogenase-like Zn-dependent dehydrogenase
MKAAQLVGRKLFEFIEVDMPTIKDGECLIKLERVSICGSDIRHGWNTRIGVHHPQPSMPCGGRRASRSSAWQPPWVCAGHGR